MASSLHFQQAAAAAVAAAGADPVLAAFQQAIAPVGAGAGPGPVVAAPAWGGGAGGTINGGTSEEGEHLPLSGGPAGTAGTAGQGQAVGSEAEEAGSEEDAGAVDDPSDSDYQEDDGAEERATGRRRLRRSGSSSEEYREGDEEGSTSESDPDYTDTRATASKRRRGRAPSSARRSVRIKDKGIDPGGCLAQDDLNELDGLEPRAPRRGLRSSGPAAVVTSSAAPSLAPSAGLGSRAGSEQPQQQLAAAPKPLPNLGGLPNPKDIRREHTDTEMAAEHVEVKGMWEMAATLDFLNLFRRQLNLSRPFAAFELEHVLAYSDGRDGLLADLHIDIMRGISPKQEVPRDAWQVHLANKIKYHWRPLLSGLHCPFKPDKYFEAYTYARLPASDRVRALHFLCTIRCDREDIQFRVAESYSRDWTKGELALVLQAQAEAVRAGRPEDAPQADFSPEVFRRQPNGLDRAGRRYYVLHFLQAKEFRMYRETPSVAAPASGKAAAPGAASAGAAAAGSIGGSVGDASQPLCAAANGAAAADKLVAAQPPEDAQQAQQGQLGQQQQAGVKEEQEQLQGVGGATCGASLQGAHTASGGSGSVGGSAYADVGAGAGTGTAMYYSDSEEESWAARQARLLAYHVPEDPELEGGWEMVATTLEEFTEFATRFGGSEDAREVQFALIIRQYVIPAIVQQKEEEERRIKAAERVQRKLGVAPPVVAAAAAVAPSGGAAAAAPAGASGSGGSGAVAAGGGPAAAVLPVDGGREVGGRSRRARQRVNYAFNDYDEQLRSAIRQTQRGEEESDDEESGRRRRRRGLSPMGDPVEAARGGLRRGRSAAAIKEDVVEVNQFVDERQLRAAFATQRGSRASSRAASRAGSAANLGALLHEEQGGAAEGGAAAGADGAADGAAAAAAVEGQHPQNGGLQEADGEAFVTAAPQRRSGGTGGGRKNGGGTGRGRKRTAQYREEEEEEEEESESEPDAGADSASEDDYVPGRG